MNFYEIAQARQSCRSFDRERPVEEEKLAAILESARLSPSACNGQPYHITVCTGKAARRVAKATTSMGMNKFAPEAPIQLVISEAAYNKTAAIGAAIKNNDYRSIDIGILAAYITAEATAQGLSSCILGWFNSDIIEHICKVDEPVRLVIALGYASEDDKQRDKKRKSLDELVSYVDQENE